MQSGVQHQLKRFLHCCWEQSFAIFMTCNWFRYVCRRKKVATLFLPESWDGGARCVSIGRNQLEVLNTPFRLGPNRFRAENAGGVFRPGIGWGPNRKGIRMREQLVGTLYALSQMNTPNEWTIASSQLDYFEWRFQIPAHQRCQMLTPTSVKESVRNTSASFGSLYALRFPNEV